MHKEFWKTLNLFPGADSIPAPFKPPKIISTYPKKKMTTTNANTSADLKLFKDWIDSLEQTVAQAKNQPVSEAIKTMESALKEIALVANAFGADNPQAVKMGEIAKAALDLTGAG